MPASQAHTNRSQIIKILHNGSLPAASSKASNRACVSGSIFVRTSLPPPPTGLLGNIIFEVKKSCLP